MFVFYGMSHLIKKAQVELCLTSQSCPLIASKIWKLKYQNMETAAKLTIVKAIDSKARTFSLIIF